MLNARTPCGVTSGKDMIRIRNLSKTYSVSGKTVQAVKPFSLDLFPGKVHCFLGPNGAGKTTTVKMLCGLVTPSTGDIIVNRGNLSTSDDRLTFSTGVVLEGARNIYWRLTAFENIDYYCRLHGLRDSRNRAMQCLDQLGLQEYTNTECRFLSRGNQQKVCLACVLALDADFLLLDEPTLGLDIETAHKVMDIILGYKRNGRIIIVTTHDAEFIETVAENIILFRGGKVEPMSSVAEIMTKYGNGDGRFSTAYLRLLKN